jgi:hypothetical protein
MLTPLDRAILDFERSWLAITGPKDREIEAVLGLSSENYYDKLRFLAFYPGARSYDPLTVRRVQATIASFSTVEAVG